MIALKDGPVFPDEVVVLALALEGRNLRLLRKDESLRVSSTDGETPVLTDQETGDIRKWKSHLLALVDYCGENHGIGS